MSFKFLKIIHLLFLSGLIAGTSFAQSWVTIDTRTYAIHCMPADSSSLKEYERQMVKSTWATQKFFGGYFKQKFDIYIYPDRKSLDNAWRAEWNQPAFTSECWMVASGTARTLNILSPAKWKTQACEHDYSDGASTWHLFTHEMVHVFHAQACGSSDFSDLKDMDWFVEGLATYASSQMDSKRIADVKSLVAIDSVPAGLAEFFTGKSKYGLAGSMVMYIDIHYKRENLMQLIPLRSNEQILAKLGTTEEELIKGWKAFMKDYGAGK